MNNFLIAVTVLSIFCSNNAISLPQKNYLNTFSEYQAKYNKKYETSDELSFRQGIYQAKLESFAQFNNEEHDFIVGENQFTDMTAEERAKFLGLKENPANSTNNNAAEKAATSTEDALKETPTLSGQVSWNLFPSRGTAPSIFNIPTFPNFFKPTPVAPVNNKPVNPTPVTPTPVTPAPVTPSYVTPAPVNNKPVVSPTGNGNSSNTPNANAAPASNKDEDIPSSAYSKIKGAFASLKANVNWVKEGIVTPVKDQLSCGGCYAFAAIGVTESLYKQRFGVDINLSEQQVINCSRDNSGCDGGLINTAMDYIKNNGARTNSVLPYAANERTCSSEFNAKVSKATSSNATSRSADMTVNLASYENVGNGSLVGLLQALNRAPVGIAIHVAQSLYAYKSGLYNATECGGSTAVNHAVIAVGYSLTGDKSTNYKPYLLIKNSWGSRWGEAGFFKLELALVDEGSNTCGITVVKYDGNGRKLPGFNYAATLN